MNFICKDWYYIRFPTRTENPWKMERLFPVRNFQQTGKVRENHTAYWNFRRNLYSNGIYYFLVIFKWTVYYLIYWMRFTVKRTKYFKKRKGKVRPEKWDMYLCYSIKKPKIHCIAHTGKYVITYLETKPSG